MVRSVKPDAEPKQVHDCVGASAWNHDWAFSDHIQCLSAESQPPTGPTLSFPPVISIQLNSILNFISTVLNHITVSKGLTVQIFMTPLTQAPTRNVFFLPLARKNSLKQGRNLGKKLRVGDPSFQGRSGVQWVPQWTYMNTGKTLKLMMAG